MEDGAPLLERDSSLASLHEYAAQAGRGEGRLVLVAGEAGVGKSALVERLRLDRPDARWSWAACDGLFTPRPLGPLFDLADQLGGDLAERCQAGADRGELFRVLLRQIGSRSVLDIVVIEDVHWADGATLDLVRFLGRRLRDAATMLIITYRDDALAADDPMRVVLGDLASQRSTRRVGLAPLSSRAVGLLAADSGLAAGELYRLTGGNPFYLTEVLRSGTGEVPVSARDAVLARAAQLSGGSREVLDAAALIGTRVEVRLLESVTGCSPAALDELVAGGLVSEDGAGLRFRHEIARMAVAQAVPAYRGQAIHRRVLAALRSFESADNARLAFRAETAGDRRVPAALRSFEGADTRDAGRHGAGIDGVDNARLAFHAEAAGDSQAVLRYAPAAAEQAMRLASHREAAAQFERALRFADGVDPATLAGLYQSFAHEVSLLDRWLEAEVAAERALALWREAGDRLREGDALRRLSRIRWNMCRGHEAVAAVEAAVSTLEPLGPSVELAWAYATFANQRMLFSDYDAAIDLAGRAQEMAVALGATDVLSDALNTHAVSLSAKGVAWAEKLNRALEIALAGGHHDQAGRAYTNLCGTHNDRREFAEAERHLAEGVRYCEEHDVTTYATCLRGEQSAFLERTGRWDDAIALSRELLMKSGPSPANRLCAMLRLGAVGARRGEPDALAFLDEAVQVADAAGEPQQQIPAHLVLAEAHWLAGRMPEAMREAELADDVCAKSDAWLRGAVAVWLRRTGSRRPARGEIAPPYHLMVIGEPVRAAEVWTKLGCPYEAALALTEAPDQAALGEALNTFTNLGAAPAVRIVRQRLRALGARSIPTGPRTATRAHPFRLTRREQEVLDLIRLDHTNAEIAAELVISAKTVDHHVSAILAKLEVPTRAAAARRAALLDLPES